MHMAEQAINSPEFQQWFLNTKFKQIEAFDGKTQEEIFLLMTRPVYCEYFVVPRPWYKRYSSVVGWTEMARKFIFTVGWRQEAIVSTYSDQFDAMSVAGLANHLSHEICFHGNGASHSYKWNKDRDMSIPYAAGNWVENYVSKNLK